MRALARLPASRPQDDDDRWRPAWRRPALARTTPAKRLRAEPAMALTRAEVEMLAKLEGKPLPRGQALADLLGVNPTAAWRLVRRLRRQGALGFVSSARVRAEACQCLTYVKVDWARTDSLDALDAHLVADAAIMTADRVTGACDYRLLSRHADVRAASDWTRALEAHPNVAHALTRFCATLRDRPNYAAAWLAADDRTRGVRQGESPT